MSAYNLHSITVAGIQVDISGKETESMLVLVHGSLDRKAGMALIAREAQKHCTVVRYDRRGYGTSNEHGGPFTVASNIEDLERIIEGRRVYIFGHSFGGHMALGMASRHPESVLGIATYETPLSWMPWWSNTSAGAQAIQEDPSDAAEAFMIRLIGKERWLALPEKTKAARRREGPALIGELSDLRRQCPWDVDSIRCPVNVGVGEKALDHHRRGAQWLVDNLHNAHLHVIAGAGHGAHVSHAVQVFQSLIRPLIAGESSTSLVTEP